MPPMDALMCFHSVSLRPLACRNPPPPHGRHKTLTNQCNSLPDISSFRDVGALSNHVRFCVKSVAARARGDDSEGVLKACVRCGTVYRDVDNSNVACKYHGHMTGDQGLYALAPPHQGIDGEWTDASGVIVYKWNDEGERPSTGSKNWKRRWTCCGVYDANAAPCRVGKHVSYDDGATRF